MSSYASLDRGPSYQLHFVAGDNLLAAGLAILLEQHLRDTNH
jgi:hypothetical protein